MIGVWFLLPDVHYSALADIYLIRYARRVNPIRYIRAVAGLSQRELADSAKTSQPTLAAYETGAKSPTWRTVERIASSVGLACYPSVEVLMTRDQTRSLTLHAAIAQQLQKHGVEAIEIARGNVSRMRTLNPHASRLLNEWEWILEQTIDQIIAKMLDPSAHGRDLRQVTPFAGLLTPAQRANVYSSFQAEQ